MNFIKRFFTGIKQEGPISDPTVDENIALEQNMKSSSTTVTPEPAKASDNFSDEPPPPRTVMHASVLKESLFPESSVDTVSYTHLTLPTKA